MALFKTDEEAWSKFTHVLETRYGGNVSPNMIQVNTVMRPLSCTTKWPPLNLHRRQLVVDTIPSYSRANISPYVSTGARVSDNYEQYLLQLNVNLRKYAPAIDEREVERKLRAYERATRKLQEFDEDARREWWRALRKDPTLKRAVWENQWRYRDKRKPFEIKASDAYGEYLAEVVPYPPLFKVTKALRAYNDARFFAKLPIDEDEAEDGANDPDAKDGWAEFRKSVISVDVNDFMRNDAPDSVRIVEASSVSTTCESRWSASVNGGGLFWNFGASASGGTLDRQLREDASALTIGFKKLNAFQLVRHGWYDESLIRTYCREVKRDEFWGERGMLNLIPQDVILGRGVFIEIETAARSYSEFQNWFNVEGSGGFRIGSFSIGGGGSHSQHFSDIRNASSGTTIRIEDKSDQIYVIGSVSVRVSDLVDSPGFAVAPLIEEIDAELAAMDQQFLSQIQAEANDLGVITP